MAESSYQRRTSPAGAAAGTSAQVDSASGDAGRRRRPRYRGNFSTSICTLFSDPGRRSDCCSIALCGVLQADRNRYLLLDQRPPPWWRRLLIWVALPFALFVADQQILNRIQNIQISTKCQQAFPDDGSGPYLDVFNSTTVIDAYAVNPALTDLRIAHIAVFSALLIFVVVLLARAASHRFNFRSQIISKLRDLDSGADANDDGTGGGNSARTDRKTRSEIRSATRTFGCLRAPDNLDNSNNGDDSAASTSGDLCSCLWRTVSAMFCRVCCGCWCECCGMCATAQEGREIELLVPADKMQLMDYVTFQPFSAYLPALEDIRRTRNGKLLSHWRAMSDLATVLMKWIGLVLLILGIYALTSIDASFTYKNMGVLLATLFQSFVLLYLLYWKWHRFDISLDAVVKFFAAGFLFSTSSALIIEMLVSLGVSFVTAIIGFFAVIIEVGFGSLDDSRNSKEVLKTLIKDNIWLGVVFALLNAFVVASLTEELCKYFGFWMVDHPDMMGEDDTPSSGNGTNAVSRRSNADQEDDKEFTIGGDDNDDGTGSPGERGGDVARRNLNSKGVAVTIAMVCTAVGFACCENLKYVFSSEDIGTEIGTLVARSIFPVHALAAAIQSIGVCRRDLEGDASHQLGRIIFPAWMLHGCFDCFLMLSPVLMAMNHSDEIVSGDDDAINTEEIRYNTYVTACLEHGSIDGTVWQPTDDVDNTGGDEELSEVDVIISAAMFGASILSVVIGAVYYLVLSRRQKRRLASLDMARLEGSTTGLV